MREIFVSYADLRKFLPYIKIKILHKMEVLEAISNKFRRGDGSSQPQHIYDYSFQQFNFVIFPQIIKFINDKEKQLGQLALAKLQFQYCNLGDEGLKMLTLLNISNEMLLTLTKNNITGIGCSLLAANQWKNLSTLNLSQNNIACKGCQNLSKEIWPTLDNLSLDTDKCQIQDKGAFFLGKLKAPLLKRLDIDKNKFQEKGCKGLSQGNWPLLQILYLRQNTIGEKGIFCLTKGEWPKIKLLSISQTWGGDKACDMLKKADWKHMTQLQLRGNGIRQIGCQRLSVIESGVINLIFLSNYAFRQCMCGSTKGKIKQGSREKSTSKQKSRISMLNNSSQAHDNKYYIDKIYLILRGKVIPMSFLEYLNEYLYENILLHCINILPLMIHHRVIILILQYIGK